MSMDGGGLGVDDGEDGGLYGDVGGGEDGVIDGCMLYP